MNTRKFQIKKIVVLGDSLSDRGTMYNRKLGVLPMRYVAGLAGDSPDGSFTNGYVWSDHLAAMIANSFIIDELEKSRYLNAADIADAVIVQDKKFHAIMKSYSLDDDKRVKYKNKDFFISLTEGGLTAYDYKWWPSFNIQRFITRFILSTLKQKRLELFQYEKQEKWSTQEKNETLIMEWSGANDFISANAQPSIEEADRAISAREKNVLELIKHGYRHFVLFNLPDLSLTPFFKAQSLEKQAFASYCINYYCKKINDLVAELKDLYPDCTFEVFDANKEFQNMYDNPEKYHLDRDKLSQPYLTSPEFKMKKNGTSPAEKFTFWDDKHPSADVHIMLAEKIYKFCTERFQFLRPTDTSLRKGNFFQDKSRTNKLAPNESVNDKKIKFGNCFGK